MKVENRQAYCKKHDIKYTQTVLILLDREESSPCPACAVENLAIAKPQDIEAKNKLDLENKKAKSAGIFRDSGIPPRYTTRTIDNFKAKTEGQQKALASVKNYIDGIGKVSELGTSMIMTGGVGTGKTHLASAIGNAFIAQGNSVAFMTVSAMFRKIRETYRAGPTLTEQQVINDLRKVDLLVLDEIGVQKGSESEEYLLFEVLNERYCHFKPTVLISNLTAEEMINYIGNRAMDRLREGGGKLVIFDWESYRAQVRSDDDLPTKSGSKYNIDKVTA